MSVRSLQDQVDSLLSKGVVQPKVGGAPSPDVETASVVESLALAMMLQPRSALYAYYLAKNGLVVSITAEIAAIDALKASITDLANVTYAIKDSSDLSRAQSAMLQLSAQGQVSSESGAFDRYSVAIDDFLTKQLGKNIKRSGSTEMVRPGEEAGQVLPSDLTSLKSAHTDLLGRLYSLAVGIANFLSTPFSSLVGANAVYRTKKDLDALAEDIAADESGAQSRDAAVRLISGRAAVRMIGAPVTMKAAVVDTVAHLPPDQLLSGQSAPTAVQATTAVGPFVMATGGSLSMTIDGQTVASSALSQAANAAAVLGNVTVFPVMVPANYHLFLRLKAIEGLTWVENVTPGSILRGTFAEVTLGSGWSHELDGSYTKNFKAVLNSGSVVTTPAGSPTPLSLSLANVLASINTTLGALGSAVEFVVAGSNRILIIASEPKVQQISIISTYTELTASSTFIIPLVYTNSFHAELGFVVGQAGDKGNTPTRRVLDALQLVFSSLVTANVDVEETITLKSLVTTPGVAMALSGTWVVSLGLSTSYEATSDVVTLQGASGPVSPIGLVDVGDIFQSSTGSAPITSLSAGSMTLGSALKTFSGNIIVTSALYLVWTELDRQVKNFLGTWVDGHYASDLSTLDQLIAVLAGSPTSPRRNEAIALLDDLRAKLVSLQAAVTTSQATLLPTSGKKEKLVIDNIIATFTERKFDRALDLLLQCKLQDIFELDWQSVSYGGALMKSVESVARSDVKFPNTTNDEGFDVGGLRNLVR